MFGKLKEKLKSWFKFSKEKIEEEASSEQESSEEKAEVVKTEEKPTEEKKKPAKADKKDKVKKKELEIIEKQVKQAEEKKKKDEEIKEIEQKIEKEKKELEKIEQEIHEKVQKISSKIPETIKQAEEQTKELGKITEELEKVIGEKEETEKKEEKLEKKEERLEEIQQEHKEESFFTKLKSVFSYKITEQEFNDIFDNLELLLLENNVALEAVESIRLKLSKRLIGKEIKKSELEKEIKNELKYTLNELLIEPDNPLDIIKLKTEKPFVILFIGINGSGKTTNLAKVAYFLKQAEFSVVLAAADTFRAASIEQISEHAEKLKVPLIKHDYNADPAAVGFDAIKYAKAHKIDVVLIDTAGRMHTKTNLIEEMKKIERVNKPDLKIFVAESIAGNDAVEQAKTFHEAIEIDGTILSKADVDEKGGTIISVSHATNKPIFFLGTGQNYKDLELFNKQKFIESLGL